MKNPNLSANSSAAVTAVSQPDIRARRSAVSFSLMAYSRNTNNLIDKQLQKCKQEQLRTLISEGIH